MFPASLPLVIVEGDSRLLFGKSDTDYPTMPSHLSIEELPADMIVQGHQRRPPMRA